MAGIFRGSACHGRPATEVLLKDRPSPAGPHAAERGLAEQNGAGEGDAIKQIVFVNDDFRMTFVSRRGPRRQARRLAGKRGKIRDYPAAQPGRKERPAESHLGRPARRGLEGLRRPGPADLSHAHRRRHPEHRAGHYRAHAAIRAGRGPAADWDMRIATSTLSDKMLSTQC